MLVQQYFIDGSGNGNSIYQASCIMNHESYLDFWVFVIWVASCVLGYHWEHLAFESGMVTVCFSTSNYVILCVMI